MGRLKGEKMKRFFILFIVLVIVATLPAKADSYAKLWQKVQQAKLEDLPETQLDLLGQIRRKAVRDVEYGHLLKATVAEVGVLELLAPDSVAPAVLRLESACASTQDPTLKAVYASAIGTLYETLFPLRKEQSKSKEYFALSLRDPVLLSKQDAKGYEPFVVEGIDSKIFNDDLLHVLGFQAKAYNVLHDYYRARGNRRAACIAACKALVACYSERDVKMRKSRYLHALDSLINVYQDLPEAGELAIARYEFMENSADATEKDKFDYINYALSRWGSWPRMNVLRNAMSSLTQPSFVISLGDKLLLPDTERKVRVNSIRNIGQLEMNVYRLGEKFRTAELRNQSLSEVIKSSRLVPDAGDALKYVGAPVYQTMSDSMTIKGLQPGRYVVVFTADSKGIEPQWGVLHVSNLFPIWEEQPDNQVRVSVLNATTGFPTPHASVSLSYRNDKKGGGMTRQTNENGELRYGSSGQDYDFLDVQTQGDVDFPTVSFNSYFSYYDTDEPADLIRLFTDRGIYRPGQTVHVALLAYNRHNKDKFHTLKKAAFTVALRDANGRQIAEKAVTTDEFGSASADFTLPLSGLTGNYYIRCKDASAAFKVEEYKRPTFEIAFDEYKEKYEEGDTVRLAGHAKTYSGVPVQGAKVAYEVRRNPSIWWLFRDAHEYGSLLLADTIYTDSKGDFTVQLPMIIPDSKSAFPRFYNFKVTAQVTDAAGETHEAEAALSLGTRSTAFSCDLPEKSVKDSLTAITFSYLNASGQPLTGQVTYRMGGKSYSAEANKPVDVRQAVAGLPSGRHTLLAVCGQDTLEQSFVVFAVTDKKAVVKTHDWFYLSAEEFPADGSPVYLQLGSSDSTLHVVYAIFAKDRVLEDGVIDLQGELLNRSFTYKPEYGDGLRLSYAWVKEGRLYQHSEVIRKPLPDKRLSVTWKTFRDRLYPGQKEVWTATVVRPGGKPAKAQMLATMYDASLDALFSYNWHFNLNMQRNLPSARWTGGYFAPIGASGNLPYTDLKVSDLDFSHFDMQSMLQQGIARVAVRGYGGHDRNLVMLYGSAMAKAESVAARQAQAPMALSTRSVRDELAQPSGSVSSQLRENLNETAFFYPNLSTDEQGNVSIRFTLPESVTTWRFMGLAHDEEMNYGFLYGKSVAKKTVMIQPNVPRFVRMGDKAEISARIFNTSSKALSGTARMALIDAESMREVYSEVRSYKVEAEGTSAVTFTYAPSEASSLLICRVTAEGKGYSDGEQHYLPVLPDTELMTNTQPFTQDGAGLMSINLDTLLPVKDASSKVTVEYTNNPAWLVIQALPYIATVSDDNAISLAAAYYANAIAANILKSSPGIRQTLALWKQENTQETSLMSSLSKNQELKSLVLAETPWVIDADNETEQRQQLLTFFDENTFTARQNSLLAKLQRLRTADGAFSWWPGMGASDYVTLEVARLLARLQTLTGDSQAAGYVSSSLAYLDKKVAQRVAKMKESERKGDKFTAPSEFECDYLYTSALAKRPKTGDMTYLLNLLRKSPSAYTIYGKANSAVIFSLYGMTEDARLSLQSLKEYSVYKERMGRYFDTPKAEYSWLDYKIPTQVAAIEALSMAGKAESQVMKEMQMWLLQSKRTQAWDTPINSSEAVYAFLLDNRAVLAPAEGRQSELKVNGKTLSTTKSTAGLGYVKGTVQGKDAHTLTIQRYAEGTGWGAVYTQFMQPAAEVESLSSGLQVTRELLGAGKEMKVGDRVKVRITIKADRDYDFVQVVDKRAACLEPAMQLSGYRFGYYCAPKDNSVNYYFDRLSKGTHVIQTEYYVDRKGTYHTGTCTVQCAYSPEFMARQTGQTLVIK